MSRFEIKLVAAILLITVIPLVASVVLVGQVIKVSDSVAAQQILTLVQSLDRAAEAYRDLFASRKQIFRLQGEKLASDVELIQSILDLNRTTIVSRLNHLARIQPNIKQLEIQDSHGSLLARVQLPVSINDEQHRMLQQDFPLGKTGHSLHVLFYTSRAPFENFGRLGQVQGAAMQITKVRDQLTLYYRMAFVVIFGAVLLIAAGTGLVIARRTAKRVAALAAATHKVAAGDLETQVKVNTRDELGALARSFNEMVSQIKENRERIAYLEKIGAWQDIARRLAHEIKNPLTPILLAIQQLHQKYQGEDSKFSRMLQDAQEIITEEVAGLRRLVNDFSAFAKLPSVQPQPVDLDNLMEDFFKSHSDLEQKAHLTWQAIKPACQILVDRMLIKHVLYNLVENAIQAAEEAKTLSSLKITLSVRVDVLRHRLILNIIDNGPGMDSTVAHRAFDPYFTTKDKGTGLGLTIVKKIILEHQGTISLHSQKGQGTHFILTLPLA